jgi:dTDP-glucose pyrophosphorylase
MEVINRTSLGIALVVDERDRLWGTVVDGDIRRAVLRGASLQSPVEGAMKARPVTAEADQTPEAYLTLMLSHKIQQLPLIGKSGEVVGLVLLKDLQSELAGGFKAVIMAGGLGTRLRPLTDTLPKPMLPVGDRPIMERVLEGLRESGIHEVVVSTHYKGELIQDHFGDGSALGVEIRYVNEEQRFGTIGGLRLMRAHLREPFLVINGDILTTLDFSAMRVFHHQHQADMTVAVRKHEYQVPYGVVQVEGTSIVALDEKPALPLFVNAGIYLINPEVIECIPEGRSFDATDLIMTLVGSKRRVEAFPVLEYWLDIGRPPDYEQANADLRAGRMGQASQ